MHTSGCLLDYLTEAVWTLSCKWRCLLFLMLADRHYFVYGLHKQEQYQCHYQEIDNRGYKVTIGDVLSGTEYLELTTHTGTANAV